MLEALVNGYSITFLFLISTSRVHVRHARVKVYCCKQITTLNFSCYKHFKKLYMAKISNEVSIVVKINIHVTIDGMYKIIGCTYGTHVFEEPHYEHNMQQVTSIDSSKTYHD